MATQFNLNDNFDSIVDWLKNQLNSDTPLITPNNEIKLEGNSKGICFWFMKVDGYSFLSKCIPLNPITPLYSKDIDGETYDLIYSFGVIHHSPYPRKIISEIKKYMNGSSVLKIMLYAKNSWKSYMIDAGFDQPEAQYGCPIANTYTEEEVVDLLDGFDIISITQNHIFPYQIEPYKKGKFIKQPWFETMPDEIFNVLKRKLGWHLLITAKIKEI